MGPSPLICGFCMQNSNFRTRITSLYRFQTSPMFFCIQNSDFSTRIAILYGSQPSSVVLCIHNSGIMTRINSLNGSQTLPVILCLQNSVISTRITSLCKSQTWLSCRFVHSQQCDFSIRIALLSMGPSLHLWFCWIPTTTWVASELTSLYVSQPSSVVLCMQNSDWFGSELQVSIGPNLHHVVFASAKQRLVRSRMTFVYWVPAFIMWFCAFKTATG